MANRMKERYVAEIAPALNKKFGYKSVMQIPKLEKVIVNVGCGESKNNAKEIEAICKDIATITGQKPITRKARKSVANFKLREGETVGVMVTLRGDKMYEFLDRLFSVALPRVRDFRGINPDDLLRLYRAALDGADVVIGSRYSQGVNVVNWPMSRLLMSWCASRYVKIVTGMPVKDATAGFVGYSRKVLEAIDLDRIKMHGYGFQIEMKYAAWRKGFKIKEVSIVFVDRTKGTSKMSSSIFGEAFWGVMGLHFRNFK